ncbi:hypothetical protein [Magnetospirillum sulfuroxidans]|uniref:ThuA-like domain-containing protein n=1 Tax=Magnetospirillum sulfuroxidans TaxID=611300 RepID=A0ABS5ICS2_9PROT|nr:hypothetical protein [Magnetospirillum sulfuroxidans]MBR9972219.1 hypothetical protein [Magnetospirillum sulfuroxidans]
MRKILAVDGGTYFHHFSYADPRVARFIDRRVHVGDLGATRLDDFDVVLLPCRIDPDSLIPFAGALRAYLDGGGTVVSLNADAADEFLPGIVNRSTEVNFWWWLDGGVDPGIRIMRPSHPLFAHVGAGHVIWHYHGVLTPPPGAISLVDVEGEGSLLYIDRASTAGRLIVSTLDPVFHHGSNFMPNATHLLYGLMEWLAEGALGDAMAPISADHPIEVVRAVSGGCCA